MSKLAIDVSHWNGAIDWAKVAPQVSAAVIRLGYRGYGAAGTLALDPMYQRNMDGAIAAGLPVGVYWCSQALSDAEALEEARYCVDKLRGYKLQYPVLLDSEWMEPKGNGRADRIGKTRRTQYGLTWCRAMRDAGYIAGLYCSESWYTAEIDGAAFDREGFEIWIAKYSSQAPAYRCDPGSLPTPDVFPGSRETSTKITSMPTTALTIPSALSLQTPWQISALMQPIGRAS